MTERLVKQELRQAERAGRESFESLYTLRDTLNSAKNWGLLDLFGGGAFSGFMKHSKMETAAGLITRAKKDLESFQRTERRSRVPGSENGDRKFPFPLRIFSLMIQFRLSGILQDPEYPGGRGRMGSSW